MRTSQIIPVKELGKTALLFDAIGCWAQVDLLGAEIAEKQARSIKYQLTVAKLPQSRKPKIGSAEIFLKKPRRGDTGVSWAGRSGWGRTYLTVLPSPTHGIGTVSHKG
jgi:hypothetical protein